MARLGNWAASLSIVGAILGAAPAMLVLPAQPAVAAGPLSYFYCYAPDPGSRTNYVSDVHPVGDLHERAAYGAMFEHFLRSTGRIGPNAHAYCVMRASMLEINAGRAALRDEPCRECAGVMRIEDVAWPRGDGVRPSSIRTGPVMRRLPTARSEDERLAAEERAMTEAGGRTGSRWTRGSGHLESTPIGDLARPIYVNGDRVMVPTGSGGYAEGRMSRLPDPPAQQPSQFARGEVCVRPPGLTWNPPCPSQRDLPPTKGGYSDPSRTRGSGGPGSSGNNRGDGTGSGSGDGGGGSGGGGTIGGGGTVGFPPSSRPHVIVYWGNTRTGRAVEVLNQPNATFLARQQVEAAGGGDWHLFLESTQPGYGAAMCTGEPGNIHFFVVHGYATSRDAVTAAQAKAAASRTGASSFCEHALWHVG